MLYESDILETIHENAMENFKIGAISEADMREYDKLCLAMENKSPQKRAAKETIIPAEFATA